MLPRPIVAVVTDRRLQPIGAPLAQAVAPIVTGGANLVIFTEADLRAAPRALVGQFLWRFLQGKALLMILDDADLCLSLGASGVHVADCSKVASAVAALAGKGIVGASVRSADAAREAASAGAAYLLVECGGETCNSGELVSISESVSVPVVVGTDLSAEAARELMNQGAAGLAVQRMGMGVADPAKFVSSYLNEVFEVDACTKGEQAK